MIRKNLIVSVVTVENKSEETILELKSSNTRNEIVLEPRLQKLVLDIGELKDAIKMIEDFSTDNPTQQQISKIAELENPMQVEIGIEE